MTTAMSNDSLKHHSHGGVRHGAGRKSILDKSMDQTINVRVSNEQKSIFIANGGARWLRDVLSQTRSPQQPIITAPFIPINTRRQASIPLADYSVQAGFPSPAEDYIDKSIDFNELLIKNEPATFVLRAAGESMIDAGIDPGDLLVVDRSRTPKNQDIVIMLINNEYTVKRLVKENGRLYLKAENASKYYPDIYPEEADTWITFGVVLHIIKSL